jgi:hypothetical protein
MSRGDDAAAAGEAHFMGPENFRALLEHFDAGLEQIGLVNVGQARNFAFLGGDELFPVEFRRLGQAPAEGFRLRKILGEARGVDIELFRHAAANDAGSADTEFLGDHAFGAMSGGDSRGAHAARTGANDEQVSFIGAHRRHAPSIAYSLGGLSVQAKWPPVGVKNRRSAKRMRIKTNLLRIEIRTRDPFRAFSRAHGS